MEKILEKTLLFDFYGELLTPHQQEIYESVVFNDMSLSEAANDFNISRQGVHDLIKRCDDILQGYEEKLHMIARFEKIKEVLGEFEKENEKTELTKKQIQEKISLLEEIMES